MRFDLITLFPEMFAPFLASGVTIMPPAYINVGAYVDEGTMVDSHALVGSCAQIGKRCHISAAAQIPAVTIIRVLMKRSFNCGTRAPMQKQPSRKMANNVLAPTLKLRAPALADRRQRVKSGGCADVGDHEFPVRRRRHLRSATAAQTASTTPNGQAPCKKP